jgi:hypothetical protein
VIYFGGKGDRKEKNGKEKNKCKKEEKYSLFAFLDFPLILNKIVQKNLPAHHTRNCIFKKK